MKFCTKQTNKKNKPYARDWELKKKYGISLAEYEAASVIRNNNCDICSKKVKSLHVDHNHTTGKVRGYLCGSCNRGLGLLQESSMVLEKALMYLKAND
jgi:hypothetical protein